MKTDKSIEWIDWDGEPDSRGLPPDLEPDDLVLVQLAGEDDADAELEPADEARAWDWGWAPDGGEGDIIAYAIIDPEED